METNTNDQKDHFVAICFACGTALKQHEISVQITGQTIDFDERIAIQNTNYQMCTECAEKSRVYMAGGMKKATERRTTLQAEIKALDLTEIDFRGVQDPIVTGS